MGIFFVLPLSKDLGCYLEFDLSVFKAFSLLWNRESKEVLNIFQ